jgi:acyl dehydratase
VGSDDSVNGSSYATPPYDGLFLEDLVVGSRYRSNGRTVTEADLTIFSMLSGDWNPIHADAEFSRASASGERLVHGVFGLAVVTGLMDQAGWFRRSAVAMLDVTDWRFVRPIHIGDTLTCEMEVTSVRPTSAGDKGVAGRRFTLLNQEGVVVQEGDIGILVLSRTPEDL